MNKVGKSASHDKDRMDKLPDSILESCILPLLPMRDAVETSLISRRWKHLWRHSVLTRRNLVFDSANVFGSRPGENNMDKFMKQYLEVYQGEKVDSLKVQHTFFLGGPDSTRFLDHWVRLAIEKGVEEIQLLFDWPYPSSPTELAGEYVFPHQLLLQELGSGTLKHLSLRRCVFRPPPGFDGFKNLRSLSLTSVDVEMSMAHLLSTCLLLESLEINMCWLLSPLNIAGDRLTHLSLRLAQLCRTIEISAPNLISLEYDGYFDSIIFVKTPPRLARIVTGVVMAHLPPLRSALPQLSSFPELETLLLEYGERYNEIIPQFSSDIIFRNLKQLSLNARQPGAYDDLDHLQTARDFLKAAPLLEEFTFTAVHNFRYPKEIRNNDVEYYCSGSSFTHHHLKSVKFQGFRANWYEIEFAIWILKHAAKLETLMIDPAGNYYDVISGEWKDPSRIGHGPRLNYRSQEDTSSSWQQDMIRVQKNLEQVKTKAQILIESQY